MLVGGLLSRSTRPEVFGSRHTAIWTKAKPPRHGGWAEALGTRRGIGGMGPGSARLTRGGKKRSLTIYRLGLRLQASLPGPQANTTEQESYPPVDCALARSCPLSEGR